MSESATLEAPPAAVEPSADVQDAPSSDTQEQPSENQERLETAVEESAPASQERPTPPATPRSYEDIDAAIKAAGSKNKALASGVISDAEGDSHDAERERRDKSARDRVARLTTDRQQKFQAADNSITTYRRVEAQIRDEGLSNEVASALLTPAIEQMAGAIGDWREAEARLTFLESLSAIKGGDELANKAEMARASLVELAGQLVPTIIERVNANRDEDWKEGRVEGFHVVSDKDYAGMQKAALREAQSQIVIPGTVSGESAASGLPYTSLEGAYELFSTGQISRSQMEAAKRANSRGDLPRGR